MMNYPNESQVNPQKSEILISYSRQELKNIDFDPTKPQIYLNKKPQNNSTNQGAQYSNVQSNQFQGIPSPQQQFQDEAMKQEKTSSYYNYPPVNKYQIQEEYYKNQSNLMKTNNIVFHKIEPLNQQYNSQQNTFNQNTYKRYQEEQQ
ncbi:unnamed protein product [Paramecium octaurelia]|uniref:Uncharacterized protein n=1 Tax=Paramecium octaurelia TaxID=43137 RepID=A0A8S1XSR1_PAROT|nr:unnamed protein product [Paramecium octaurelia]